MNDPAIALAVVIPTFNEVGNVSALIARLDAALKGIVWEAIFVDDASPDGTADAARTLALTDRRVRVLERIGRRGLSSACIEGMLATPAPFVAVIDGDLQHDETLLPRMLALLQGGQTDIVIGSRFTEGGGTGDWDRDRLARSRFAAGLSRMVLKTELTDPMSGFFAITREAFRGIAPHLSGIGFKILLDILTAAPRPLRVAELGYVFSPRLEGESKLDHVVALEYLIALYEKLLGRIVPARFAMFGAVGALGVLIHFSVLTLLFEALTLSFTLSQAIATMVALTFNFWLNNMLTYRDRRLKGWKALTGGWLSFALICGVGAIANVAVAAFLFEYSHVTWSLSALAGIAVGAVWNFALSSRFTWGRY